MGKEVPLNELLYDAKPNILYHQHLQGTTSHIRVANSNVPTICISSILIIEDAYFPSDVKDYRLGIATTMATY